MDVQAIFENAKEYGAAAVRAYYKALSQKNVAAKDAAQAAYDAYFADVRQREAKVKKRIEGLRQELAGVENQIKTLQPALVSATVDGDMDMAAKVQSALADMETQKAAAAAQIEMLSGAHIRGSEELFMIADAKLKELDKANVEYREAVAELYAFVREQYEAWKQLEEDTCNHTRGSVYYPKNQGSGIVHPERLYEHFRKKQGVQETPQPVAAPGPEVRNLETARYTFGTQKD